MGRAKKALDTLLITSKQNGEKEKEKKKASTGEAQKDSQAQTGQPNR